MFLSIAARNGDRSSARNRAILITDMRRLVNTDTLLYEAAATRAAGVEVIAVGVGGQVDERELRGLTSPPQVSGIGLVGVVV